MPTTKTKNNSAQKTPSRTKPKISEAQISDVATKALTLLYPRIRALESYAEQLQTVDSLASDIIKRTIGQAIFTYWTSLLLYILTQILPIALIATGIYLIIYWPKYIPNPFALSIFCIVSGIIILIAVLSRSPLKNVKNLMINAMKLNIVYSGYTRQIHQVDVAFKEVFSHGKNLDPTELEEMMKYLQDAIDEATTAISEVASDLE